MKPLESQVSDTGEITVECSLDEPPEKVWRALTEPELVAVWLDIRPGNTTSGESRPRFSYEIVDAEPCRRLRYRWRDEGGERVEPDTFVTFELTPRDDGGTWFRLTHEPARMLRRAANGNAPPLALAA